MKNRKIISAVLSVLLLTGCSEKSEEAVTEPSSNEKVKTETVTEITDTEPVNIFGDDYDPFADGYDPYGNGGVVTEDLNNAVTTALNSDDEEVQTAASEKNDNAAETVAQTEVTTREQPAEKVTERQTSAKPAQTTETEKPTETQKTQQSEEKSSDDIVLTVSSPNGWNDGSSDFAQFDISVKNKGKSAVGTWTVTLKADSNVSLEQSWNCNITIKNGTLTVTPVDYNSAVDPGGEATCGFILKNPGKADTENAVLTVAAGTFTAAGGGNNNNNNNNNGGNNSKPANVGAKEVPAPSTDDWLSVKGNRIVDSKGKEVWLTGVNWFGYNTGTNTFDGLWACDLNTSLAEIADHGFNLLRVPISAELINSWAAGSYPEANYNHATNSYLVGMNSLEIFDYAVGQCHANGLKIMIDIHSAKTDSMGHMQNMWYNGSVSEQDYLDALSWMADRYKGDDTIIAYDLKNEPHGKAFENPRAKWDNSKDADNWKYVAEKAAKAVLSKNPNALVMVEGIEIYPKDIKKNGDFASTNAGDYYSTWWGGNLRGVKDYPIDLGKYQNKLVYSPHDYGPAVYEQEWFKGSYDYESLKKDAWNDNWLFIHDSKTAPLLIGEWGGFMTQPNLKWMTYLRQLIKEKRLNHTFWCFNANSGDTGGLVKDDFVTWDEEKYEFVKEVLWQENGKFVGLDHEIPLGKNGKTLS